MRFRPVGREAVSALVAPASPFSREDFDAGLRELERLGLRAAVYDDRVFNRQAIVAGPAAVRAASLREVWDRPDIAAILAVRGGYGSVGDAAMARG